MELRLKCSCTTETKTEYTRRVREVATIGCIALSPGQCSTTWWGPPEPPIPPGRGKKPTTQKLAGAGDGQQCLPVLGSCPYSDLTPKGLQGNLWGLITGNRSLMKGGKAHNHQHTDPGRSSSDLPCPASSPNQQFCSVAEPCQGHTLTRELGGGTGLSDRNPHRKSFAVPKAQFAHAHVRSGVVVTPTVECLPAPSHQEARSQFMEAVTPSGSPVKGRKSQQFPKQSPWPYSTKDHRVWINLS